MLQEHAHFNRIGDLPSLIIIWIRALHATCSVLNVAYKHCSNSPPPDG